MSLSFLFFSYTFHPWRLFTLFLLDWSTGRRRERAYWTKDEERGKGEGGLNTTRGLVLVCASAKATGRQLFETSKVTLDDEGYYEEGATEIDLSKYTREEREKERRREEDEEERRRQGMLADEGD